MQYCPVFTYESPDEYQLGKTSIIPEMIVTIRVKWYDKTNAVITIQQFFQKTTILPFQNIFHFQPLL